MKKIKIILALVIWIAYIDLYNIIILPSGMTLDSSFLGNSNFQIILTHLNNWLLGIIATFSVLVVIYGGAGYIIYSLADNKEKEKRFWKVIIYGIIGVLFSGITYSLTVSIETFPV